MEAAVVEEVLEEVTQEVLAAAELVTEAEVLEVLQVQIREAVAEEPGITVLMEEQAVQE
jgi:hypothetical protein